ncbi:MAG: hypothetical protein PQJ58_17480, partial [Spirochaetales bacterium]|nr:hypothetical protein [Spirochaetales bacterium]
MKILKRILILLIPVLALSVFFVIRQGTDENPDLPESIGEEMAAEPESIEDSDVTAPPEAVVSDDSVTDKPAEDLISDDLITEDLITEEQPAEDEVLPEAPQIITDVEEPQPEASEEDVFIAEAPADETDLDEELLLEDGESFSDLEPPVIPEPGAVLILREGQTAILPDDWKNMIRRSSESIEPG